MTAADAMLAEALQAVLDAPEDDVPRLVYADLLVQRKDPRGEFIRMQCALSSADITHGERLALRKSSAELLGKHQEQWIVNAGLPKNAEVIWSRGFIDRVTVNGEPFAGAMGATLFATEPVRAATVSMNSARVAKLLAKSPHFHRLRELTIAGSFGDEAIETLLSEAPLSNLRALNLGSSKVGNGGFCFIATDPDLSALERLSVSGCNLQGALAEALSESWQLPALHTLYATRIGMDDEDLLALVNHPALTGLMTLTIARNEYSERATIALLNSPSIAALRLLEIDLGDKPSTAVVDAVLNSPHLLSVRNLRLDTRYWMIPVDERRKLENKYGRALKWA